MVRWFLTLCAALMLAVSASAQGSSYKIKSGDQLMIEVLEDSSLNRSLLVLPDGNISFPLAGTVRASGLTVGQLKSTLTAALNPNFASTPSVFVTVQSVSRATSTGTSRRGVEVFLIGEVNKPGSHSISRGTTILQFLAQSGGFTRYAAKKRLQLQRTVNGEPKVYTINYKAIEDGSNVRVGMTPLQNGDVIVVPERRLFE